MGKRKRLERAEVFAGIAGTTAGRRGQREFPLVTPILLEVAADLLPLVEGSGKGDFLGKMVPEMREALFYDLGVRFPGIRVRGRQDRSPGSYQISINEVPAITGTVDRTKLLVDETVEGLRLRKIEGEPAINPASGRRCAWIPKALEGVARKAGLSIWDAGGYLALQLSAVLRKNAGAFLGLHEVKTMLVQLEASLPSLVQETVPNTVSLFQLADVLRRLVEEEISIRDLRTILQSLAEWGQVEHDTVMLTEHVRSALKRYITHKFTDGERELIVHLLDPQIEALLRSSIQHTPTGSYLALDPQSTQEILAALRAEIGPTPSSGRGPVILTTSEVRLYLRRLVELEFPHIAVISYQELSPDTTIRPVSRISLDSPAPSPPMPPMPPIPAVPPEPARTDLAELAHRLRGDSRAQSSAFSDIAAEAMVTIAAEIRRIRLLIESNGSAAPVEGAAQLAALAHSLVELSACLGLGAPGDHCAPVE